MAPKAPSGAAFMMMPMTPNIAWAISSTRLRSGAARCPSPIKEKPNRIAKNRTCSTSPIWKTCGPPCLADARVRAADEGADDAVRDDVQDEIDRPDFPRRLGVAFCLRGLFGGQGNI